MNQVIGELSCQPRSFIFQTQRVNASRTEDEARSSRMLRRVLSATNELKREFPADL